MTAPIGAKRLGLPVPGAVRKRILEEATLWSGLFFFGGHSSQLWAAPELPLGPLSDGRGNILWDSITATGSTSLTLGPLSHGRGFSRRTSSTSEVSNLADARGYPMSNVADVRSDLVEE